MLEELITKCDFRTDGVYLGSSGLKVLDVYHFMHEAIADDHLPVYKVCGFNLSSSSKVGYGSSVTERNPSTLENTLEIAYNLTDKIFLDLNGGVASVVDYVGDMSLSDKNDIFMANAKYPTILHTNNHILTAIHPVTLKLRVMWGTGYWSMQDTYKYLQDSSYFPMTVRFTINDMCRICPPMFEDHITYKMSHGFTPEYLKGYFISLYGKQTELSKEDMRWLLSYER